MSRRYGFSSHSLFNIYWCKNEVGTHSRTNNPPKPDRQVCCVFISRSRKVGAKTAPAMAGPAGSVADLQPPLDEAREDELRERAQRLLTRRSLIAFDLDKTVLHQGHHSELQTFTMSVCQTLIQLAAQQYNISAVTGNDLHQLSSRFMRAFVEELCRHRQLQLLSVMHLFCNCATVYICFSLDSPVLAALLSKQASLAPQQLQQAALEALFHSAG